MALLKADLPTKDGTIRVVAFDDYEPEAVLVIEAKDGTRWTCRLSDVEALTVAGFLLEAGKLLIAYQGARNEVKT
jgi:hypothetical protein